MSNKRKTDSFRLSQKIILEEIDFEERLKVLAEHKKNREELEEMNKKINELIKAGKSSGAIKQTIKKLFPKLTEKMEQQKISLPNGEFDRLTLQLQDRVERFRNSLPYEKEEIR